MAKVKKAKGSAYRWVQHADQIYVAVRFLYWKGFPFEFALFGAHVMELYLKAYLIHKTGKYPRTHDLGIIYKECMKYDDFFKDRSVWIHFLPVKQGLPDTEATWTHYLETLRYPESLADERRPKGAGIIAGVGGTHRTLDCIAHFVREQVPQPAGDRDIIDDLINGDGYIWAIHSHGNLPEIKELFLCDNEYFSS